MCSKVLLAEVILLYIIRVCGVWSEVPYSGKFWKVQIFV